MKTDTVRLALSTRRTFLGGMGTAGVLALGALPPLFLARAAEQNKTNRDGKILVLLQLAGGNDGLNTVIPHANAEYYRQRPSLAVGKSAVLKLNDELGLHPQLAGIKSLHDDGLLSIIQGVGYPNPNRSHFRSMDIWHSARPDEEISRDGWMGRAMDAAAAKFAGRVPALALGTDRLPLALVAQRVTVPTVKSLKDYQLSEGKGNAKDLRRRRQLIGELAQAEAKGNSDLDFLHRTASTAIQTADKIAATTTAYKPAKPYPQTGLGQRLQTLAQLITADIGPQVFFVSLDGFDTHSDQAGAHAALLGELGGAVQAFFADLKAHGLSERVMLATFSEFGRRVKENGSLGTDHGAASQMFLVSAGIKSAIHGKHPDLHNLDEGDLKHHTDFRQVYATLLEQWLDWPSEPALLGKFAQLKLA